MHTYEKSKTYTSLELGGRLVDLDFYIQNHLTTKEQRQHIAGCILKNITKGYILNEKRVVIGEWKIGF